MLLARQRAGEPGVAGAHRAPATSPCGRASASCATAAPRDPGGAAAVRRHRDVRVEARRQVEGHAVPRRHARKRPPTSSSCGWIWRSRSNATSSPSSTSRSRHRTTPDLRRRSPGAMGPSDARRRVAGGVHPGRRAVRPDPRDRRVGAAHRMHRGRVDGPAGSELRTSASTCRRRSSTIDVRRHRARRTLAETGLPPHRLMLEITESMLVDDSDHARHDADAAARPRRAHRDRRLRHRLLVARLPRSRSASMSSRSTSRSFATSATTPTTRR